SPCKAIQMQPVDGNGLMAVLRYSTARVDIHRSQPGIGSDPFISLSRSVFEPQIDAVVFGNFDGALPRDALFLGEDDRMESATFGTAGDFVDGFRADLGAEHVGLWDLNLDGIADRVWLKGSAVAWQYGIGTRGIPSGRFSGREEQTVPGSSVTRFFVADFTGDERPDILAVNNEGTTFFLRSTNDDFALPVPLAANPLAVGDWNGDGRADIASRSGIEYSTWDGSTLGVELPVPIEDVGINFANPDELQMTATHADFDGQLDLALVGEGLSSDERRLAWVRGNGEAPCAVSCAPRCGTVVSGAGASVRELRVTDLDGDGRLDAAISAVGQNATLDPLSIILVSTGNDGEACSPYTFEFNTRTAGVLATVEHGFQSLSSGDIDYDGEMDLTWSNHETSGVITMDAGVAGLSPVNELEPRVVYRAVQPAIPSDLNADGRIDLLGSAPGDGSAILITGSGGISRSSFLNRDVVELPTTHPMLYSSRFPSDLHDEAGAWVRASGLSEVAAHDDWTIWNSPMHVAGNRRSVGFLSDSGVTRVRLETRGNAVSFSELTVTPRLGAQSIELATDVLVLVRHNRWRRAPDEPMDIEAGSETLLDDWLPTASFGGSEQTLFIPEYEWVVLDGDDEQDAGAFADGTGRGFFIGSNPSRIEVRVDLLGDVIVLTR
ncbi:MAG: VCBS repeat-containing protein, partial [Myxococcota bacterium]